MIDPRNPLNDSDVDGNTMAWMADKDREGSCGCGGCGCHEEKEKDAQEEVENKFDQAENACDDR